MCLGSDRRGTGKTLSFPKRRVASDACPYIRPAGMNLTLIRITMRIGMPCAIVAVGAVGLFIVVRHFAWMG